MSAKPSGTKSDSHSKRPERLQQIEDVMDMAYARIDDLWDADVDEFTLIRWTRVYAQLAGKYRLLEKDSQLDELEEQLDLLEKYREMDD